jgi:hypothetical protein
MHMPDIVPHHQPSERIARLVEWKPTTGQSGALIGKATICFAGGWTISGIPVFQGADGLSVGTPDAPLVDRDGVQLRDESNKRRYVKVVSFATSEARKRWQVLVLGALAAGGITGAPEAAP